MCGLPFAMQCNVISCMLSVVMTTHVSEMHTACLVGHSRQCHAEDFYPAQHIEEPWDLRCGCEGAHNLAGVLGLGAGKEPHHMTAAQRLCYASHTMSV